MSTLATMIRNAAHARLSTIKTFQSIRKTPIPTLHADQCPALGVYMLRETMNPDGDSNTGPPRYICDAVISFTVVDLANKPEVLEGSVDDALDLIEETLLRDGTFLDMRDAKNHPILDSIPTITRSYNFPQMGENWFLEARLQMTFRFFCFFEPRAPNMLTKVSVHTTPFDDKTKPGISNLDIPLGS